jgi:hypothetical protein
MSCRACVTSVPCLHPNGVLANEAFDVKPSSGKISLQVEGAEMDFRNFELHPLDN